MSSVMIENNFFSFNALIKLKSIFVKFKMQSRIVAMFKIYSLFYYPFYF